MPAPLVHIETTPTLPEAADVVVIGGGVVGAFTAYYLARRGVGVALLEKGRIGAEQSSRNWGWCRQQNRDARTLSLASHSLDLWSRLSRDLGEESGFRRCGLLYLSEDEAEIARWAAWRDVAAQAGVTTHILDRDEAAARGGATTRRWKGGVFSPSDGIGDPARAAPVVARGVLAAGGSVHQMCAARGIETEGGRVSAVVTERGTIRTRTVVMAGGAWASSFCRQLGIRFPQSAVRQSILAVRDHVPGLPDALHTPGVSITRRGERDGHTLAISGRASVDVTPQQLRFAREFVPMFARRWRLLRPGGVEGWRWGHETLRRWRLDEVTPMERQRILDPRPDPRLIAETVRRAVALMPALRGATIGAVWAGYIDSTPDGVPAIGEVTGLPGFVLAAGFSGQGFGTAPGAGHLVADLVTGAAPAVDPRPYHPDRFAVSAWGKVAEF